MDDISDSDNYDNDYHLDLQKYIDEQQNEKKRRKERNSNWKELKNDYMTLSYTKFAEKYTPDLFMFSIVWYFMVLGFRILFSSNCLSLIIFYVICLLTYHMLQTDNKQ